MKKIINNSIFEEEVKLCPNCLVECDYGSNDWDSFYTCPECEGCNFNDLNWQPLEAKKIIEELIYYDFKTNE